MTTYRAAFLPPSPRDNDEGTVLTRPEHSHLSDTMLIRAALPALAEHNDAASKAGLPEAKVSDIIIGEVAHIVGDWTE